MSIYQIRVSQKLNEAISHSEEEAARLGYRFVAIEHPNQYHRVNNQPAPVKNQPAPPVKSQPVPLG